MKPRQFHQPGKFLHGNIHNHSNRSDSKLEPAEFCSRNKSEGNDFITITVTLPETTII